MPTRRLQSTPATSVEFDVDVPVAESARACSYIFSEEVQKTCQFWLLTFWLLTVPSASF